MLSLRQGFLVRADRRCLVLARRLACELTQLRFRELCEPVFAHEPASSNVAHIGLAIAEAERLAHDTVNDLTAPLQRCPVNDNDLRLLASLARDSTNSVLWQAANHIFVIDIHNIVIDLHAFVICIVPSRHRRLPGGSAMPAELANRVRADMSYNGWKNWETWNVALWCDNEEGIYRDRMARKPRTAQEIEDFVRDWYPNGTPDMTADNDDPYSAREAVDWDELAEHWCEDYEDEDGEPDEAAA